MAEKIKALHCVSCGAPLKRGEEICRYCGCTLVGVPEKQKTSKPIKKDYARDGRATLVWHGMDIEIMVESYDVEPVVPQFDVTTLEDDRHRSSVPGILNNAKFTLKGYLL